MRNIPVIKPFNESDINDYNEKTIGISKLLFAVIADTYCFQKLTFENMEAFIKLQQVTNLVK